MKTKFQRLLSFCVGLLFAGAAHAQTFTNIVNFDGVAAGDPFSGVLPVGNLLFGVTSSGGVSNYGAVYSLNPTTGAVASLYSFLGGNDGRSPVSDLILSSNVLIGTASVGGASGNGTIFSINTNGTGFTVLYTFTGGGNGADPECGVILGTSNVLYGTAFIGGQAGFGNVYRVNTNGSSFTNLHSFTGGTNGSNPQARLLLAGNTLFGTTYGAYYGGTGYGTVFKVNTDGTAFSTLYNFTNGIDGSYPQAGLTLVGGTLYGTASMGGTNQYGTVFSISTNGSNFSSTPLNYTAGANSVAALTLYGSTLYGTAYNGGADGWGTVFSISTNLTGLASVYQFTDFQDGAVPESGLMLAGSTLYGTTEMPNAYGAGTVYGISLPGLSIPLSITRNGNQVVLSWSDSSFTLQTTTNLLVSYTNVSGSSPYTTNIATNGAQFFRLIR